MTTEGLPVIVVGAGPVGCFLAYRLGKAGISVIILEKSAELPYSPRAVGYFGATQVALKNAGLYDLVRKEGFMTSGLCWRPPPIDNGKGGKTYNKMVTSQPLCTPGDKEMAYPAGLLHLRQSELTKLILQEALKTGAVQIHFNQELEDIEHGENNVTAIARNVETGTVSRFTGTYLAGTDGGKSKARKILGIPCLGHTWPERLISTDVMMLNEVDPIYHTCYVIDTKNPTVITPLTTPTMGERSLWRYTISVPSLDTRSDAELATDETIRTFYEEVMVGQRPLDVDIKSRTVYRIHQRLVPTMRRMRCVLAGDAAHLNNPYGAMGLNTGLLDADALSEALIMIVKESRSDDLLTLYSDERRRIFQSFVDPVSTANKLRLEIPSSTDAVLEDEYFREMQDLTPEVIQKNSRPYFEKWATNIRSLGDAKGL